MTEKVYQAFQAGVIPVWLGTGSRWIATHLLPVIPPQSVVLAADFPSELALVQYLLRVSSNASEYRRFHSWRRKDEDAGLSTLQRVYDISLDSVLCRVCRHLRGSLPLPLAVQIHNLVQDGPSHGARVVDIT